MIEGQLYVYRDSNGESFPATYTSWSVNANDGKSVSFSRDFSIDAVYLCLSISDFSSISTLLVEGYKILMPPILHNNFYTLSSDGLINTK